MKAVPATADNVAFGETERVRAREFASKLSMRVLSRMWQMLLKGITEVQAATQPAAAEMVWLASPMSPTCRRRTKRSG